VEHQRPNAREVLPQVHALDEGLLVEAFLGQGPAIERLSPGHPLIDRIAEGDHVSGRQQAGDVDKAVPPIGRDDIG
jgi:hypothetical protein